VFQIGDDLALVQTVDVFSPSADDPYLFGQIAAANALSDVYAMGGRPITALSIIGFPTGTLPDEVMREILRGGLAKMAEAEVPVIGGHSLNDREIKAGFAVTGLISPRKIMTNAGARPGDRLVLTKPLGTGVMAFAAQIGRAPAGGPAEAARWMATLNRSAAELMLEAGAHASTDVTGFGLMGHLAAMASASGVDVEIIADDLPLLSGALACAAEGILSGALERNREAVDGAVVAAADLPPAVLDLCFDPQTSGGLLIALPASAAEALVQRLHAAGITQAAAIGTVLGPGAGRVHLRGRRDGERSMSSAHVEQQNRSALPENGPVPGRYAEASPPAAAGETSCCPPKETDKMSCCSQGYPQDEPDAGAAAAAGPGLPEKYQEFLQAANAPGALDARTKRAMALALSVLARCEPCLKYHLKNAREMGFSPAEIEEAAWMGIAFGGSPAMAFYHSVLKPHPK
jgi:selenide,water dikinase